MKTNARERPWLRKMMAFLPLALAVSQLGASEAPLHKQDFQNIINKYTFVGDFSVRPETRPLPTEEVFWRYPLSIPKTKFPLAPVMDPAELEKSFPSTVGEGRAYQHINRGRKHFLEGNIEEARTTWLGARARYGKEYPHHRRIDYFLSQAFLRIALAKEDQEKARNDYNNAATFLAWSFIEKANISDPVVEQEAPRGFYNLAAIYFNFGRYAAAYGAANEGLNYLRKTGRKEFRSKLRQILAESFIQNRTYLEAVQELDQALRQDVERDSAAAIFARVGDIYFDLNNFELAEDSYALANRIDQDIAKVNPTHFVLRGESLFWMGQFSEAQKMFHYALSSENFKSSVGPLPNDFAAVASIRLADSWLARGNWAKVQAAKQKMAMLQVKAEDERKLRPQLERAKEEYQAAMQPFEKAKIGYFRHMDEYRGHPTALQAKVRLACLELPEYEGRNIQHARQLLAELKKGSPTADGKDNQLPLPKEAIHMSWACEVGSYAQHERTKEMVERVREFANLYPYSRFLNGLIEPVREVKAKEIDEYFARNDLYGATAFFEKTRKMLFAKPSEKLQLQLFNAYTDINLSEKAGEFWEVAKKHSKTDVEWLRLAVVAAEQAKKAKAWRQRNTLTAQTLVKHDWTISDGTQARLFINRILGTDAAVEHLPWIYKLGQKWAEKNTLVICEILYPTLSRLWDSNAKTSFSKAYIQKEATRLIDQKLIDIYHTQTSCGYSLMEFEVRLYKDKPKELAEKFVTRTTIPIDPVTANIVWTLSERLYQKRELTSAQSLWRYLRDNGSSDIVEVKYAKARLDNRKTELEKLWD